MIDPSWLPRACPGCSWCREMGTSARSTSSLDRFATACQQLAQAAGDRGQDHVVDLGLVGVGDLLDELQAAADDGQPAVGPDRAVEAGAGGTLLGEELPPRRPGAPRLAQRAGRVGEARPGAD